MSNKAAEHHKKALQHLTHAARHHGKAAWHHQAGRYERAVHHAHRASGHTFQAGGHADRASKAHVEHVHLLMREASHRVKNILSLVQAIARGQSIDAWANKNDVPRSTAFRWASDPKVRREVETSRRRALSRAIGRLSSVTLKAANGIVTLAKESESESVQLRAWRAILADQMAVSKFSDLEFRMAEIEEQLDGRTGHTDQAR